MIVRYWPSPSGIGGSRMVRSSAHGREGLRLLRKTLTLLGGGVLWKIRQACRAQHYAA